MGTASPFYKLDAYIILKQKKYYENNKYAIRIIDINIIDLSQDDIYIFIIIFISTSHLSVLKAQKDINLLIIISVYKIQNTFHQEYKPYIIHKISVETSLC